MTLRREDIKPGVVLRSRIAVAPVDVRVLAVVEDVWAVVLWPKRDPIVVSIDHYLCSTVDDGGTRFDVAP